MNGRAYARSLFMYDNVPGSNDRRWICIVVKARLVVVDYFTGRLIPYLYPERIVSTLYGTVYAVSMNP